MILPQNIFGLCVLKHSGAGGVNYEKWKLIFYNAVLVKWIFKKEVVVLIFWPIE
jgi:hypothetical protein